jgi:hypothetical protein
MHRRPHIALGDIHHEVRLGGLLVRVVDASEALDLAVSRLGVDAAAISLLRVLERRRNVHEVEATVLLDQLAGRFSAVLKRRDGRGNDYCAGLGELGCDEGDAADVAVAVFACETEFGGELGADRLAEEERDGASALLVEGDVEGAGDGVLARVLVAGQEDGETLLAAGRVRFAEDADDFWVGEPFGDLLAGTETFAEFCAGLACVLR